jgi:hypothetical protein
MRLSLRALQIATVILYMGPLLGGLAGFGWGLVPPFLSIFVLWLVLLRPHQWPQTPREWATPRAWLAALSMILSQVVLVAALFGAGRGIGGVLGTLPLFHPLLPVAVSFLAIPLLRLVWDTDRALAEGLSVDELLYPRSGPPRSRPGAPAATGEAAIAPLLALEGGTDGPSPAGDVRAALDDLLDDDDGWARLEALSEALAAAPTARHLALRKALIAWATDPRGEGAFAMPGALRAAFAAAGRDEALLRLLLPRAQALLSDPAFRKDSFPDPAVIDDMARRDIAPDLAESLLSLARSLGGAPKEKARAPLPSAPRGTLARRASLGAR